MKKIIISFAGLLLVITGCKKEFTEAGFDTVKKENYQFKEYIAHTKTYSQPVDKVFSQNLPVNSFGIYRNPAFGISAADLLIQFNNSTDFNSINFRNADSILFVELRIPYHATKNEELSTDTDPVYDLDSVFGDNPFKVKAFESNYYLFPYDPYNNLTETRIFYSDFDFMAHTGDLLYEDNQFFVSSDYLIDTLRTASGYDFNADDVKPGISNDTLPPHFVLPLDTTYFRQHFFDKAGMPVLTDNELFKNHFRGIYIHAEALNNDGSFILFKPGIQLVIAYRYLFMNPNGTPNDPTDDYPDHAYEKIILNPATVINLYRNDFYPYITQQLNAPDTNNGEEKIFVKGQAGAQGTIELFNPTELYELRNNNWLINQANIRFYVDENEMAGIDTTEYPKQLYLYKFESGRPPISDLSTRWETGETLDPNLVLSVYNGRLEKDNESGKYFYEFNITRHVKEVLRKDSSNVKLHLKVMSGTVFDFIQNPNPYKNADAYAPYGIVLQGNQAAANPVELRIYYTEPEED